jgi:hypothetical protein
VVVGANLTSAALSSATSLVESNTKAAFTVRANPYSGYTLNVGAYSGTNAPYLQNAVYNGGSAAGPLHLNPFGGNVSVGAVNPTARLHVQTGVAGETPAQFVGPTLSGIYVDFVGAAQNIYDADAHTFRTKAGGSTRIFVDTARTYIMGSATGEPYALGVRYNPTGGTVYFGATNATTTPDVQISNSGGSSLMTLQNGGNVGIGTTAPGYKLDVRRSNSYVQFCDSVYQTAKFGPREANDGYCTILKSWTTAATVSYWQEDYGAAFWSVKQVINSIAQPPQFYILTNGNVGIGTTTPTAKLDILGNNIRLQTFSTPVNGATPTAGNLGEIRLDANYLYVCTGTGTTTWKRVALTAF